MEASGKCEIFEKSVQQYNLTYIGLLVTGILTQKKKVCASKPYSDTKTKKKLQCVGHVHKRIGTRLINLTRTPKKLCLIESD